MFQEMTVKGLEPELSRMAARQQQEIAELRNLHRQELEAVELRSARRTTELMDDLRADLVRDKEEAIQREIAAQRIKYVFLVYFSFIMKEADCKILVLLNGLFHWYELFKKLVEESIALRLLEVTPFIRV